ncbi:uncharacterized protein LOC111060178 [Nilaparvata lugens]|uniref:uncharacterized protein LOC111060178 n=1 Tax=Nilaparvata lugens TaxID=108931 RepID=UPI00193CB24F|nr:uncharacterized protein LOC111060178 [Nilaparvata lugens]
MLLCAKCNLKFSVNTQDVIKCSKCEQYATCTRIRTVAKLSNLGARKESWQCDTCNTNTGTSEDEQNSILDAISLLKEDFNSKLDSQATQLSKITSIEALVTKTNISIESIQKSLENVKSDVRKLQTQCANLKKQNSDLSSDLWRVKQELRDIQQYSRSKNLEFLGIPQTEGEDVYEMLKTVAACIGQRYSRADISVAHRVPLTKSSKLKYPPIIVSFISKTTRAEWLSAGNRGKQHQLLAKDLHPTMPPENVYINEHLTPHYKFVLSYGKMMVKERKLHRANARNGKVWVKTSEQSPPARVWFIEDIDHIITHKARVGDDRKQ